MTVPDFGGMDQAQAEAKASDVGLIAVFIGDIEVADPSLVGKVVDQDPAMGTSVNDGSSVGLFLGKEQATTTTSSTTTTTTPTTTTSSTTTTTTAP